MDRKVMGLEQGRLEWHAAERVSPERLNTLLDTNTFLTRDSINARTYFPQICFQQMPMKPIGISF